MSFAPCLRHTERSANCSVHHGELLPASSISPHPSGRWVRTTDASQRNVGRDERYSLCAHRLRCAVGSRFMATLDDLVAVPVAFLCAAVDLPTCKSELTRNLPNYRL